MAKTKDEVSTREFTNTDNKTFVETKQSTAPTLSEFRTQKGQRFNLKKIIIGFVLGCGFVSALVGSVLTVPFCVLALWMQIVKSDKDN